jgi:hypothetical protein
MKTLRRKTFIETALATCAAVLVLASCGTDPQDESTAQRGAALSGSASPKAGVQHRALCEHTDTPGQRHCFARVVVADENGFAPNVSGPSGLNPADIVSAYKLPSSGGSGKTIAIVDAQDDPNAEKDLGVYRTQFGLPACTTANGCFKKVNQTGTASPLPKADSGWAGEIALDIEMASAACPSCKILLVEASSANDADLMAAEATAAKLGASVISNSWGGAEDSTIATNDSAWFNHPGVAITVAAGDDGYGAEYPATSKYVTSVGGTNLKKSTSTTRGWTETVWGSASNVDGGTGSGCSKYIAKPTWQKDTSCTKRMATDMAAVADPNTGVSVYDTYGGSGWAVYGGTSAAAPIVAAILAVTGNSAADSSLSYTKTTAFFDITSGTNGSCSSSYLCTAKAGYDGPTGNGSPNGALLSGGTTCTPACTGGTSSCAHDICTSGKKLTKTCDPCVTKICAADSFCCNSSWDATCVDEVTDICGETC